MEYLVEFNNGLESDKNQLTKGFTTIEEAKKYAKENNDVFYLISKGEFDLYDGIWQGAGRGLLTNCNDSSIIWFYSNTADFCEIEAF